MEDDLDLSDHKVTSEVHVFSEGECHSDDERIGKVSILSTVGLQRVKHSLMFIFITVVSKFSFTLPNKLVASNIRDVNQDSNQVDDDGDPVLRRKNYSPDYSLSIGKK